MNLDLRGITGPRDRVKRTYPGDSFVQGSDDQYRVTGTVSLDLDVRKDGAKYRLIGRLDATLEIGCCRCLEPFPWSVGVDVDLLYLPETENGGEGDFQIEESDLSTAFYRDEQIDLRQLMQEQFQLALPMKPLCRDDCRGLCAVCGGNRNTTACDCVERWEDPRLAVLKGLMNQ